MSRHLLSVERLKRQLNFLRGEEFIAASSGTHHQVFLSKNYVIRFRDDDGLLTRETDLLKRLRHPLVPKVFWVDKIDESEVMIEGRLPGKTIDSVWKSLRGADRKKIAEGVIEFIQYLRKQKRDYFYSVKTGKKYPSFFAELTDGIRQKSRAIKEFKQTGEILDGILSIISNPQARKLLSTSSSITVVHGDLIIHNLLTDGKDLTGVLDWELALFGDPDYDLFRLRYYEECAKAYQQQGIDETFESDFMDKVTAVINTSKIIENQTLFNEKYQFVRAIFYLNALYWAVKSDDPTRNIQELINQWRDRN